MTQRAGFYCFDPIIDSWINDPGGLYEPRDDGDCNPLSTIDECQRLLDLMPELKFYYLPKPGAEQREMIPVPLFPAPDHEVITDS